MHEPNIVVVTGASAGVGRAIAVAFAARGAHVVLLARGEVGLRAASGDVERAGGKATSIPTDVADADAVASAADYVEREIGPIDVWVNNAMTTVFGRAMDIDAAEFRRATEVTYLGQVHGTLAALRHMVPRDRGAIVNVGSALAFRGIPLQSPYCAAKFACRGFTEAVRAELLHDGSNIRISMVHLPAVNTPQFGWCRNKLSKMPSPVPPIYEPHVAAERVVAVALDGRRHAVVGGWNRLIIEANKLIPGILDFYTARTSFSAQQTDRPVPERHQDNLVEPLDGHDGSDHGIRGAFDRRTGGVLDREFLRQLPDTMRSLMLATLDRANDLRRYPPTGHAHLERPRRLLTTQPAGSSA